MDVLTLLADECSGTLKERGSDTFQGMKALDQIYILGVSGVGVTNLFFLFLQLDSKAFQVFSVYLPQFHLPPTASNLT